MLQIYTVHVPLLQKKPYLDVDIDDNISTNTPSGTAQTRFEIITYSHSSIQINIGKHFLEIYR
ncbi:hypothetical protein T10_6862 [Trichinella papuae]|uniref:Uncharacterized protein n=1 Tax=Trichinella papuae TaxID=268474 RepID=A0A0V1N1S2_9BILA|nr:hypothetical protein T10_6862 [Trichinella papuae]